MIELLFALAFPVALIYLLCDFLYEKHRQGRWEKNLLSTEDLNRFFEDVLKCFLKKRKPIAYRY